MQYEQKLKREKLSHAFDFVCQYLTLTPENMKDRSRKSEIVQARQAFYHLMRKYHYDVPFELIGAFVNYNHGTVQAGCNSVANRMQTEPRYRKYIMELEAAYEPTIVKFQYVEPPIKRSSSILKLQDRIDQYINRFEIAKKQLKQISNDIEEFNQLLNKPL